MLDDVLIGAVIYLLIVLHSASSCPVEMYSHVADELPCVSLVELVAGKVELLGGTPIHMHRLDWLVGVDRPLWLLLR